MSTPGPLNANYQSLVEPFIDVCRDMGAVPDGLTDCSGAINAAISAAATRFGAATVYFPPGTYLCKSTITLLGQVHLRGSGIEATIIQLASAVNADLMSSGTGSINVGANNGASSTGGIYNWSIADLTLDGNKANQSAGPSYCLRAYAYGYVLSKVRVRNGYSGGVLLDWNGGATSPGQDNVEAQFTDIKIHDCNNIGLQFAGPHDSQFENVSIFANGTHGVHVGPNATGCLFVNMRSYAVMQAVAAVAMLIEAANCMFMNCIAQDSDTANVVILANEVMWIGQVIGGTGAATTAGVQIGQSAGGTPYSGSTKQAAGVTTAVTPFSCYVEGILLSNNGSNGQLWLANDGGNNNFQVVAQQASGKTVSGTVAATSQLQVAMNGLTADGTLATGGWNRFATNANKALTISDRTNDVFNVNTTNKRVELINGALLRFYSDAGYTTRTIEIGTNGTVSLQQSTSATVIATSDTINTNVGIARVNPAANVTSIKLAVGTLSGQLCLVSNESAFTVTLHTNPATSNVVDSATEAPIQANSARLYAWNGSAWYPIGGWYRIAINAGQAFTVTDTSSDIVNINTTNKRFELVNNTLLRVYSDAYSTRSVEISGGTLSVLQSSSAAALTNGALINTSGVGVARVNPGGAVTGIILQQGSLPGQQCWVVNESANSVTMAASGTSNVADGTSDVIAAQTARLFVWDAVTSLWYKAA